MSETSKYAVMAWPLYAMAVLLVGVGAVELVVKVWPWQPGVVAWRFGAVGLLSVGLMGPLLGLILAWAGGLLREHRRVQRGVAILAWLLAAVLVVAVAAFILDAVQLRARVRAEMLRPYEASTVVALLKLVLGTGVALCIGTGAWRSARSTAASRPAPESAAPPILVRPVAARPD